MKSGWMLFNVFDLYVYSILIWEGGTEASESRPQTSVFRVPALKRLKQLNGRHGLTLTLVAVLQSNLPETAPAEKTKW